MNGLTSTHDDSTPDGSAHHGARDRRTRKASLTERYVHAVVRDLPEDQRNDLARELRSTIADMVEADLADGTSYDDAERAALVQLGHPALLASSFAQGPQFLIGPRFFNIWKRLVRNLLLWVPALAATLSVVAELAAGGVETVGDVVVAALAGAWGAAVQVVFWPTLVFAILERTKGGEDVLAWDPDMLPDIAAPHRGITLGEAATGATWSLVVAAALVLQHDLTWIGPDSRVPLLDPDLWTWWLPFLIVVAVSSAALELWKYRAGWTPAVLAATVVTSVAFSGPVAWLAQDDRLLNPGFVEALDMTQANVDVTNGIIIAAAVAIALWEIGEALYRTATEGRRTTEAA